MVNGHCFILLETVQNVEKADRRPQTSRQRLSDWHHSTHDNGQQDKYPYKARIDHRSELVRFLVVEPAHPGSGPRLGTDAHIFIDLFQALTALCFQW
jgi:hypothetical protein